MMAYGPHVVSWVTEKLGVHPQAYGTLAHGLGLAHNGKLRAGVVFCNNNGNNLHAHIASDGSRRWLTREFLSKMFEYPFVTLGVPRITATTDAANAAAVNWLEKLGFVKEGRMKKASNTGGDLLLFRMFREECRWLILQ